MNRRIWDFWANKYERLWVQKVSLEPTRRLIIDKLNQNRILQSDLSILDMGCGTGQLLREVGAACEGMNLTGVDISLKMLDAAACHEGNIHYVSSDILSYNQSQYDLIFCSHSFPYYTKKDEAIQKLCQLLKPKGLLFLAQACENSLYDKFIMALVKLTAGRAKYWGKKKMEHQLLKVFASVETYQVPTKAYMPSIQLFICRKDEM